MVYVAVRRGQQRARVIEKLLCAAYSADGKAWVAPEPSLP
jgi:hypothetical protein